MELGDSMHRELRAKRSNCMCLLPCVVSASDLKELKQAVVIRDWGR